MISADAAARDADERGKLLDFLGEMADHVTQSAVFQPRRGVMIVSNDKLRCCIFHAKPAKPAKSMRDHLCELRGLRVN